MLILAILTGDFVHLLSTVHSSLEWSDSSSQVDVGDLLALLIVVAKKIYLENPPKRQFD
jgi:hypothetical protein